MTKHPTSRRVHRTAHDEDVFVSGVLESSVWAREHGRFLVIAGVTAVVAIGALLYFTNYRSSLNERAAGDLSQVRATVQSGNVQLAKQDLERYVNRFGNTPAGAEAKLLLGQIQLQANEPARAIETLRPLADDAESPLGFNAALMMASAQEINKQLDEAERTYLRVADDARFVFQKREALDRAARLRLDRGNPNGAAELYERIIATFEEDSEETHAEQSAYEMRLAEIRAQTPATGKS
jgi:predicted negative regulator of RcsB-dependent stress response